MRLILVHFKNLEHLMEIQVLHKFNSRTFYEILAFFKKNLVQFLKNFYCAPKFLNLQNADPLLYHLPTFLIKDLVAL